ncbi:hypothetical protein BH18ACT3_BH18ACT3_21090 [soil metagenome]|jgi:hypothetical protein
MTVLDGGLVVRFASSSRRLCLVAGASLGTCAHAYEETP